MISLTNIRRCLALDILRGRFVLLALACVLLQLPVVAQPLRLEREGSERVYFSYRGQPLLSFGGMSDFIFYAAEDAYDYKLWADWAEAHGINHIRAYPPLSWRHIEKFARDNGGSIDNVIFPYEETNSGSRIFDLERFNDGYWRRFRMQIKYLQKRGIIVHLLMWNGWQLRAADSRASDKSSVDWDGHFFNPAVNVNAYTDTLGGDLKNRLLIYESAADANEGLLRAQKAWFEKLVEETWDLDNVYYDLVHEIGEHHGEWSKLKLWIDAMVSAIQQKWSEVGAKRPLIIGMDTGGIDPGYRNWIFSRPYFNLLIYGKSHKVENARDWRMTFRKPYIPQESWDDHGVKYGYIHSEQRTHTRKYMWKFMMAKCQQMDLYIKPRRGFPIETLPSYPHNYDPRGLNPFEDDALLLRNFWNRLTDYGNLWYSNESIESGPGAHRYMLASDKEAVLYFSSATGEESVRFEANTVKLVNLPLNAEKTYQVSIFDPKRGGGVIDRQTLFIRQNRAEIDLPAFTDDIAIHIHPK